MAKDRGHEQIARCFYTHNPGTGAQELMHLVLERGQALATLLVEAVPDCRERSLALTELEAAITHARAGLAREPEPDPARVYTVKTVVNAVAAPQGGVYMTVEQVNKLAGAHALLARAVQAIIDRDNDSDYEDRWTPEERATLDGFVALHGGK